MMEYNSIMDIEGALIGEQYPTYFIADIAANHDGSIERAKDLIWRAKEAGANAAKFQHFSAETIVSDVGFKNLGTNKSHQTAWSKSVFEVYKDASVDLSWTPILKKTCEEAGITFFTSPYSFDLVEEIDPFVQAYKIGSGDINWLEIVEHIAKKNKPYILATGASTMDDVVRAVETGLKINPKIALLQCNTNYTGNVENMQYVQLNVLRTYRAMFPNMILGLSDHTPGHATVLGSIALGARIVEKHFTDDVKRLGPDHKFSMDPKSWREMINRSRELEAALGSGVKKIEFNEMETVVLQRRSIRLRNNIPADTIISREHIDMLRPCPKDAISPHEVTKIIGRKIRQNLNKGDYLRWKDLY